MLAVCVSNDCKVDGQSRDGIIDLLTHVDLFLGGPRHRLLIWPRGSYIMFDIINYNILVKIRTNNC